MTDQQITIAMAGLDGTHTAYPFCNPQDGLTYCVTDKNGVSGSFMAHASAHTVGFIPMKPYLTDANAVLPLLEKEGGWWQYYAPTGKMKYFIEATGVRSHPLEFIGLSDDPDPVKRFCRAACEAKLRAHGLWREGEGA